MFASRKVKCGFLSYKELDDDPQCLSLVSFLSGNFQYVITSNINVMRSSVCDFIINLKYVLNEIQCLS